MSDAETPEEMAEEYALKLLQTQILFKEERFRAREAYLAGYKAAQEHAHAALEEAEARIQELRDRLMEESGGRLRLFKDDADAKAAYQEALEEVDLDKVYHQGLKDGAPQWISVKDRLPDEGSGLLIVYNYYLNEVATTYYDGDMWCTIGGEYISHWQELPEPPKEEG